MQEEQKGAATLPGRMRVNSVSNRSKGLSPELSVST